MNNHKISWVVVLAALVVVAFVIVGCASGPTPPPAATATSAPAPAEAPPAQPAAGEKSLEGVTLTVSRWAGDPWEGEMRRLAAEFEAETGAKVVLDAIPYENLREKQVLEMSGQTGTYDIVYVHPGWFGEYVDNGYLTPLDDFVADPALNPPGFSLDKYVPSILEQGRRDGKLYSFQDFIVSVVLAYRTDLFEQAGIPEPQNWEDVLAAAEKLNNPSEISGVCMPGKRTGATMDVYSSMLLGCGGWYFDEAGNPALDSPCAVEAAKFYGDLSKYTPEGLLDFHWDQASTAAAQGKCAMVIMLTPNAAWLNDPERSTTVGQWGYVPLKYEGKPSGVFEFWHWAIPSDSQNPEAAYRFIEWFTDGPQQASMAPATATGGNTEDFYADSALVEKVPVLPAMQAALSNSKAPPAIKEWPEIQDAIELHLQNVFTDKETPEQAVQGIQADMTKILGQ